jgi:hypothetical protein
VELCERDGDCSSDDHPGQGEGKVNPNRTVLGNVSWKHGTPDLLDDARSYRNEEMTSKLVLLVRISATSYI